MPSVLIPLAPGCEELEAVTIIDLLRRAGIEVVTAGLEDGPVCASRSTRLLPDTTLDEAIQHDYDMIALPGGPGADRLRDDTRILELLRRMAAAGRFTAAICAAPKVLAAAGLLEGRRVTAFPGTFEGLNVPRLTLTRDAVVRDDRIITSRGPGTAMDFALELIEALAGREVRVKVEGGLQRS
jgi:4-methyl-5(b-hydroxyethyl)-thiazole monophosphate biosynthesis